MLNNKPNTLFILHLPPPIHGAAMVGKYIQDSLHINEVLNCRYINLSTSQTINEIGKGGFLKWWRFVVILVRSFWNLLVFRPEIVYLTLTAKGSGFYKDALLALLIKGFGKKVVYHFHNKGVSDGSKYNIANWLYKKVFKDAEVILLSKHLYPDVQKYVAEERIHYCPNGIPDAFFSDSVIRNSESNTKVTILFLSNLISSKGVFVLLDACAILYQKKFSFECKFIGGIGDVTEDQFNNRVRELKLDKHVFYVGKKYGDEKIITFKNADIFTLPTFYYNECFPLVLLEAMQFKVPIVTTSEGGISDVVEDGKTGFIIDKKNPQALADKLEILINNKELRESMGSAGRKKFEEEFTIEHFEKNLCQIFVKILTPPPTHS
jgi:glycosyltransferase involved in cell wall biosynthesis